MGRLRELNLSGTSITTLPSSIMHLHGIENLDLSYCMYLESLPCSIYSLSFLKTLLLNECPNLEHIEYSKVRSQLKPCKFLYFCALKVSVVFN